MKLPASPSGRAPLALAALSLALVAFHLWLAADWTRRDVRPPGWDPAVHLATAQDYRDAWSEGRWLDLIRTRPKPGHPQYPPFYHYTLAPVLAAERPHAAVAWINLGYLFLLVAAGTWIAYRLGGAAPAAAAMLALALSPGLLPRFREAFTDLSLAAWVTAAYAFILASDGFARRREALAAGVCAALALSSKWGAVLYLLPGAALGLADGSRRRNLALALGAAALCLPWYLVNSVQMLPRIWTSVTLGHHQGHPLTWTWNNWTYYPRFVAECFGWPVLVLAAAGAALAASRAWQLRRLSRAQSCVAAWLAFSYLFCTLVPSKDVRYFFPAVAAVPALGLTALPAPAVALAAAATLVHARDLPRPQEGDWRHADILEAVRAARAPDGLTMLCVLPNHRDLNATALGWELRHAKDSGVAVSCYQSEIPEWTDFVLAKTGDRGHYLSDRTHALLSRIESGDRLFRSVFREHARWPLPDGSTATLYRRRDDAPVIGTPRRFSELTVKNARLEGVRISPRGPRRYEVEVSRLTLSKFAAPVTGVRVLLEDAQLVESDGKVYVARLGRATLRSARLRWDEASRALSSRLHLPATLSGDRNRLAAEARLGPLPVRLQLAVEATPDALTLMIAELRLGGWRVPGASALSARQSLDPSAPFQPFALRLGALRLDDEALILGDPL